MGRLGRYVRNHIWPFYYYHKNAGWKWNLANCLFALGEFIYYKVYNRIMDWGHNLNGRTGNEIRGIRNG